MWNNHKNNNNLTALLTSIQKDLSTLVQDISNVKVELNSLNELLYKNENSIISRIGTLVSKVETLEKESLENKLSDNKRNGDIIKLEKTVESNKTSLESLIKIIENNQKTRGNIFYQMVVPIIISLVCPIIVSIFIFNTDNLTNEKNSSIIIESSINS